MPALDITGVTLPGTPAVVAGSNGHIAWGFTNSYGDFTDARFGPVRKSPDYRERREHIAVKGGEDVEVIYHDVGEGVVLDDEDRGRREERRLRAGRVDRDAPRGHQLRPAGLERARNVDDALTLAPRIGIPGQNMVVGDARRPHRVDLARAACRAPAVPDRLFGAARIPRRLGSSAHRRSAGRAAVDGEPARGRWRARAGRSGDDEVDVGAGGYDIGARARQIRDDLVGLAQPATEADMLEDPARCSRAVRRRAGAISRSALLDERRDARLAGAARIPRAGQRLEARGQRRTRWATAWCASCAARSLDALWNSLVAGLLGENVDARAARRSSKPPAGASSTSGRPRCRRRAATGARSCWRASTRPSPTLVKDCGSARVLHLRQAQAGRRAPSAVARACRCCRACSTCRPRCCPAITTCRACRTAPSARRSASRCRPGTRREGYLELPGGPSGHPLSPFYRSGFDDWVEGRAHAVPARSARRIRCR